MHLERFHRRRRRCEKSIKKKMRERKRIHEEREKEKKEIKRRECDEIDMLHNNIPFVSLLWKRVCGWCSLFYFESEIEREAVHFVSFLNTWCKRVNTSLIFCTLMRAAQFSDSFSIPHTRLYTWCELATSIQRNEKGINDDLLSLLSRLLCGRHPVEVPHLRIGSSFQ